MDSAIRVVGCAGVVAFRERSVGCTRQASYFNTASPTDFSRSRRAFLSDRSRLLRRAVLFLSTDLERLADSGSTQQNGTERYVTWKTFHKTAENRSCG